MPAKAAATVLRVALPLLSIAIFLATGEVALRIIYRDGGKRTLGAPGFYQFEHVNVHDQQRGRLEWGAKRDGVPRVMILGDSITWGTGVRDWQDAWPEQLARLSEQEGRPREWAVLSLPGRDINAHVDQFREWAPEVQPDVLVYQWYVNDIEIDEHRPVAARRWREFWWHEPLRRSSYLYYFFDNRLHTFLPAPERSYVEYILTDYIPGSLEWSAFERYFHALASRAREVVPVRLLVLYPQVPFSGEYPLKPIHDRMKALARARTLSIPPVAWIRRAGAVVPLPDARWKMAVELPANSGPRAAITRGYYARGAIDVTVSFKAPGYPAGAAVASLEAVDEATGGTLAHVPIVAGANPDELQEVRLRLALPDQKGHDVQLAAGATGPGPIGLAGVDLAVRYDFDVLDLTDTLNTFDTHVSIFDAHPNPRAHRVIAESVLKELDKLGR
jgi:hypothetical protein